MLQRRLILIFLSTLYFIFLSVNSFSQSSITAQPNARQFTPQNGLPSWNINCSIRDNDGFLWFGTDKGVCRFDGLTFKTFDLKDSMADDNVSLIYQDFKNRIWFCSSTGKLSFYTNGQIVTYPFNNKTIAVARGLQLKDFYVDSNYIYLSLLDNGIKKIDQQGNVTDYYKMNSQQNLYFIEQLVNHKLLFAVSFGSPSKSKLILKTKLNHEVEITLDSSNSQIIVPCLLRNNNLIVAIADKLFEINDTSYRIIAQTDGIINDIKQAADGKIWLSTDKTGLYIIDPANNYAIVNLLYGIGTSSVVQDIEGGFWISTLRDGIYYLTDINIKSINKNTGLLSEQTNCITHSNNTVYAGFDNGSLFTYSNNNCYNDIIPGNIITSAIYNMAYSNALNKLFVGAYFTFTYSEKSFTLTAYDDNRQTMIALPDSTIWYSSFNKLFKLKNNVSTYVDSVSYFIRKIIYYSTDNLLIGTSRGVYSFNITLNKMMPFMPELEFLNHNISALAVMANDNICVAIDNKGLLIINGNKTDTTLFTSPFNNCTITKIEPYHNELWVTTNKGLYKIDLINGASKNKIINHFGVHDGLSSNDISDLTIMHDTVWVASNKGVDFFDKNKIAITGVPPITYISSVSIADRDTALLSNYNLHYDYKSIKINYTAIAFRGAEQTLFKYRVIGLDTNWHITNERQIQFLSLPPGTYHFEVYAINISDIESKQPAIVNFTIAPPFYATWWFRIAAVVAIAGLTYLIGKARVEQIKTREEEKTAFNKRAAELEMKALRAQMNPHFIFNVMNSIQHYMLHNDTPLAQKYLSKFAKLIRLILDNSGMSEITLAEELKALALYVELEQQRFDEMFDYIVSINSDIDTDEIIIPSMMLQPYVENSIKHGISHLNGRGKIAINITRNTDTVFVHIEDNGVGRLGAAEWNKMNVREHISHGTAITSDRIDAYNLSNNTKINTVIIDLHDDQNNAAGTRVEISIPQKDYD